MTLSAGSLKEIIQICDDFGTKQEHLIIQSGVGRFAIHWDLLFWNTYGIESKMFETWSKFSFIHNKILGRYAKSWIFHQNNILLDYFLKTVHGV